MSFVFNNAIRNKVTYIEYHCHIISLLMDVQSTAKVSRTQHLTVHANNLILGQIGENEEFHKFQCTTKTL